MKKSSCARSYSLLDLVFPFLLLSYLADPRASQHAFEYRIRLVERVDEDNIPRALNDVVWFAFNEALFSP